MHAVQGSRKQNCSDGQTQSKTQSPKEKNWRDKHLKTCIDLNISIFANVPKPALFVFFFTVAKTNCIRHNKTSHPNPTADNGFLYSSIKREELCAYPT